MGLLDSALLAVALGVDTFSVCVGIGLGGLRRRTAARLIALFGLVPGLFLLFGSNGARWLHALLDRLLMDSPWSKFLAGIDPALVHARIHQLLGTGGAAILMLIGLELIRKGHGKRWPSPQRRRSRWAHRGSLLLVVLSVNTDALAAGVGLGVAGSSDLSATSAAVAGIVMLMAAAGLGIGARTGPRLATRASLCGGLILIALGLRIAWRMV